jgi:biopolymer transport protein ExbD
MPASRFHRAKLRRAERATSTLGHGGINLVPLIDVLTSIVFFSLVSYQGLLAELTSFDLALPPMIITAQQEPASKADKDQLNLLLAVRLQTDRILIEHSAEGGFHREIPGLGPASLDTLQQLMGDIHRQYPQNNDVLVIPGDDVSYDDVVHVLERLKLAQYPNVALGTRARTAAPAPLGGATAAGGP